MSDLFSPFKMGNNVLNNRVVMAPLTRSRAKKCIADELTALYYTQRATAGLIVTEGTPISREGTGYLFNPSIFSPEQVNGWRLVTQSVHAVGAKIFAQIWHVGRVSHRSIQENGAAPVSASSKVAKGAVAYGYDETGAPAFVNTDAPRALATAEISRVVGDFVNGAENAVAAGFDGVEIHGANGYLIEQFLNPFVNDRTDEYGAGTLENRLRFVLEVVDAIIDKIGADRVAIRLSPYGQLYDMGHYPEIVETYTALVNALGQRGIAYVHIMDQSGFTMGTNEGESVADKLMRLLKSFRPLLPKTAIILAGGMTRGRAEMLIASGVIDLAAFGQAYIANPDLVARLRDNLPLAKPDRATFYGGNEVGYVDYPAFADNSAVGVPAGVDA